MQDWVKVNNKKKVKKIHPLPPHIGMNKLVVYIYTTNSATLSAIGVPDILMTTCRKVLAHSSEQEAFTLKMLMGPVNLAFSCRYERLGWHDSYLPTYPQIYKDSLGYCYAVSETLERVAAKEDNFLREIRVKVFQKTGRLIVIEALDTVGFTNYLV